MVVGERRVFDINFAHNAHFDLWRLLGRDRGKILHDALEVRLFFFQAHALAVTELLAQFGRPLLDHALAGAGFNLIGLYLVIQQHQGVAVDDSRYHLADHRQGDRKTRVVLQAGKVQRDDRDLIKARLMQRFAQQVDIIARTAAATRLCDNQRCAVQVIFAAFEGINELADHQQGGIARIVVHIFEPFLHDARSAGGQQLRFIAIAAEHVHKQLKMDGQHHRA